MSGIGLTATSFRIIEEVTNCLAFIVVVGLIIRALTGAN